MFTMKNVNGPNSVGARTQYLFLPEFVAVAPDATQWSWNFSDLSAQRSVPDCNSNVLYVSLGVQNCCTL
jgi:hypothetical protein